MRVAMIAAQAPPVYSGAGAQALRLGQLLAERGLQVELLTLNQLQVARREVVGNVVVRRCPGEALLHRLGARPAQMVRTALFMTWLTLRLAGSRYDVVHVHGAYWWSLPAAVVCRLRGIPLVVKVTRLDEDDARTVADKRVGPLRVGAVYGLPFRWAAAVIGISEEIVRAHEQVWPVVPVERLSNGVDTDTFRPEPQRREAARSELALPADGRIVLFVGYLAPLKGLRPLLEAWRDIATAPAAQDATLVLAGPDRGFYRELDDELLGWIRDQASDGGSVRLLGHVELEQMPDLYRAADVFVLPSFAEGMPNSLLEALASGLPAVVTDIPGSRDVVDGCSAAATVPPGDSAALRDALGAALRRIDGGSAAVAAAHAEQHFSLRRRADQYEQLYRRLVSS